MRSISGSAVSSFAWSSLAQGVRLGTQILGLIILARLLPASDFGVIAMASVVTGFALLFRDFGTVASIIQRPVLTPQLLDSVFLFNVGIGIVIALLLVLLAPVLGWFFSEPRLRNILWALTTVFPLGALGLVQQALLERESNFKPVALIESLASLLGLGAAIAAAVANFGAYSLVLQTVVASAVTTAGLWFCSSWRPGRSGTIGEIRDIWAFSGSLVGFNVFNYFARNVDNMLVGRMLGAAELGYYTMAYRIMLWPLQNISSVVGRALFPVFSRIQNDSEKLSAAYLKATASISLITAPLMFGLFVLRDPFIASILGKQWAPVADLLAWLAPIGLLQSIGTAVGTLYLATGRTDLMFRWGLIAGTVVAAALALGVHWGLQGLVVGYAIATTALFFPSMMIPLRLVGMKIERLFIGLIPSMITAFSMALVVAAINQRWDGLAERPNIRLVLLIALGVSIYGFLTIIFQRRFLREIFVKFKRS